MTDKPDILVVGAGFAGLYAAYRFRKQGLKVKVLEAASDVGGTWYWNRYPGARCDIPSLEYSYGFSPELEQEWDWPEVYSAQSDILRYLNHVADRFDLRPHIQFDTRVTSVEYSEEENLWRLTTEQGETFEAPFCVMATGCLSVPSKPNLPGADTFSGQVLQTSLWPKEPVDLKGKRVGVIGTGSSGVQAIPELAMQAGHLHVFQRTPVYTMPADRRAMPVDHQQEYKLNYRQIREMQQNDFIGQSRYDLKKHGLKDKDSGVPKKRNILDLTPEERHAQVQAIGPQVLLSYKDVLSNPKANEVASELYRENIRSKMGNSDLTERLLPHTFGIACKRPVLDRDFHATFKRDNVTLVDVQATPIESLNAEGLRTTNAQYDLDVLVYATGFDAMTGALLKANIRGRNGQLLTDKWNAGPVTYMGLQMHGFPNLFTVTGPGSPSVLSNMVVAIEQHVNWIGDCIEYMCNNNHQTIEPHAKAEQEWVAHVNEVAQGTIFTSEGCNSWYLGANIPGKPRIFMPYVAGYPIYRAICEREAANGYKGFALG